MSSQSRSNLEAAFADNTTGLITAADMRNFVDSIPALVGEPLTFGPFNLGWDGSEFQINHNDDLGLQITNDLVVQTFGNVLDDGSGNMILTGATQLNLENGYGQVTKGIFASGDQLFIYDYEMMQPAITVSSSGNPYPYVSLASGTQLDDGFGNMVVVGTINGQTFPIELPELGLDAMLTVSNVTDQTGYFGGIVVNNDGLTLNDAGVITFNDSTTQSTAFTGNAAALTTGTLADARLSSNIPLKNAANTFTNTLTAPKYINATTALTSGSTISWNTATASVATLTLGTNATLSNPTNLTVGTYVLTVKQDSTGSRTLAYGTAFKWPGGTAPTLSTTANAVDVLTFISDGTNLYGSIARAFA